MAYKLVDLEDQNREAITLTNEELEIVDTAKQERELAEKDVNEEWRMMSNEEVS